MNILGCMTQPSLYPDHAEGLVLRPYTLADAPHLAEIANDPTIFEMTLRVPFPYKLEHATGWISTLETAFTSRTGVDWAITRAVENVTMGSIGLEISDVASEGSLGFWVAKQERGNGYCTAAAKAVVEYAFSGLKLRRITSFHNVGNERSGNVLRKIGMKCLGVTPAYVTKQGVAIDCVCFELSR